LLASPHYGERWAQHWLDVVRYAESNGYELDAERPHAWHFRDYVIRSFNQDKPYDQFVTEQLAGDLLAATSEDRGAKSEALSRIAEFLPSIFRLRPPSSSDLFIATGFNRCGPIHLVSGNTDPEVNRQEVLTEMTGAVGSAFLGLTIGCARCHDHKFDPVTQVDYYQLQAFFAGSKPDEVDFATKEERQEYERRSKAIQQQLAPLTKKVAELEAPYKATLTQIKRAFLEAPYRQVLEVPAPKRTPAQKKLAEHAHILIKVTWDELVEAMSPADRARRAEWRAQIHALEAQKPSPPTHAWAIREEKPTPPTYVLKRGDPKRKGKEVHAAIPELLRLESGDSHTPEPHSQDSKDRLALARWLTGLVHPLTARVLVNRLWQHHFGRGLVATPNDFGLRGEAPSHPELLDWLACEFVEQGWSTKHMHRLMVLSNTYQQASRLAVPAKGASVDPNNRLLWHMNRHRLEGEALRDCVLAATGRLNPKLGGPMIRIPLEPEVLDLIFTEGEPDGLWPVTPDVKEHTRRSIYLFAKRNVRVPLFESFDQPDSLTSCPVRPVTTFAPQALILLNGPFMQEQSKAFALRLLRECGSNVGRQIDRAFCLALARPPRDVEVAMARDFLKGQTELLLDRLRARLPVSFPGGAPLGVEPAAAAALADFVLALLNRNEFLYID
jgi:hypothetical protein